MKFIAHRRLDRTILKVREPHAPKTLSWRVSNCSTLYQGKVGEAPFDDPGIKKDLCLAMNASTREPRRKSLNPVTRDILKRLLPLLWEQEP